MTGAPPRRDRREIRPVFLGCPPSSAGWWHVPAEGRARGAVVVCPAIGVEELASHRVLRDLATGLQDRGIAVLRLDYRGTGDAPGAPGEVASVEAWIEDVRGAIGFARSLTGGRVAVVGLRLGAALAAAAAAADGGVDGLLLWDPLASGRAFLREQQALRLLAEGDPGTGTDTGTDAGTGTGVELLAAHLSPPLAESLRRFALGPCETPPAPEVAVFERAGRAGEGRLRRALEGSRCRWAVAEGQEALLDVELWRAVAPAATMAAIATAAEAMVAGPERPVCPGGSDRAVLSLDGGRAVVEHARFLAPFDLAAVVAEPEGRSPVGPTVVCLNAGLVHKTGPGGFFVEVARDLAAAGMRAVRLDLPGIGDSEAMFGQPTAPYPAGALSQLVGTLRALRPEDPGDVVLVGLCSGGRHAAEVATAVGARGVCLVNPALFARIPAPAAAGAQTAAEQVLGVGGPVLHFLRRNALARRVARARRLRALYDSERLSAFADRRELAWALLDRTGVAPSPTRFLRRLQARGVPALLVCGEEDARRFRRRATELRRLQVCGALDYRELEGVDHSLYGTLARRRAREALTSYVVETFLGAPGADRRPGR